MTSQKNGERDVAQVMKKLLHDLGEDVKRPFSYKIFALGLIIFLIATVTTEWLGLLGFALMFYSGVSYWGWLQENSVLSVFSLNKLEKTTKGKISERDRSAYRVVLDSWNQAMDLIGTSQSNEYSEGFLTRNAKQFVFGNRYDPKKSNTVRPSPATIYSAHLGLIIEMRTPPGWTLEKFQKVMPMWSEYIGYPMKADSPKPGQIQILVRTAGDVLQGVRPARTGDMGTKALVARGENGQDIYLDFAEATHTIIQGSTRSGKSVFAYGFLGQIAFSREVEIWGIDPNAVLLAPVQRAFDDHPERFVIGTDPEKSLELLERVVKIMDDRIISLVDRRIEKISEFTSDEPVMVLILEEYASLLRSAQDVDKKMHDKIKRLVGRIYAEGAKAGIRAVMILQRADAVLVDGPTRSNAMQRITLGVDKSEAVRMLHEDLEPEEVKRVLSFMNGRFIMTQNRETFVGQGDYLDYTKYCEAMELLAGLRYETRPIDMD